MARSAYSLATRDARLASEGRIAPVRYLSPYLLVAGLRGKGRKSAKVGYMDRRDEYHKLYSCYLKLQRVQHHANVFQDAMDGFLGSEPYSIICERDPKLDEYILWTKSERSRP